MGKENHLLIHSAKAIGYRFKVVITNSRDDFGDFRIADHARSPREIVNHMRDLLIKTKTMIREKHFNCPSPALLNFQEEVDHFFTELTELQDIMRRTGIDEDMAQKLLQGPVIDMATHIGQIAMLNGLHGNKIPKQNYFAADV